MMPLRCFIGFHDQSIVSYSVLQMSLLMTSTKPLAITPLVLETLPITRRGLTPFTFSRFLVPWLCGYKGQALFMDSDMLCLSDISEVFKHGNGCPISVVQNEKRFEWASLMLFNCEQCEILTPEFVQKNENIMKLQWADRIGHLPPEWNHLVGYDAPKDVKMLHYTQGIPCFNETKDGGYREEWEHAAKHVMSTKPWMELMGTSVHYQPVMERLKASKASKASG